MQYQPLGHCVPHEQKEIVLCLFSVLPFLASVTGYITRRVATYAAHLEEEAASLVCLVET